MRFLAILFLFPAACGGAEDKLIGKWEFDKQIYELTECPRGVSPEEYGAWLETAKMELTFTEDTVTWEQRLPGWGNRSAQGSYRVLESQGRRVELSMDFGADEEKLTLKVGSQRMQFGFGGRSFMLKRVEPVGK